MDKGVGAELGTGQEADENDATNWSRPGRSRSRDGAVDRGHAGRLRIAGDGEELAQCLDAGRSFERGAAAGVSGSARPVDDGLPAVDVALPP